MSQQFARLQQELGPRWRQVQREVGQRTQGVRQQLAPTGQRFRREATALRDRLGRMGQQPRGRAILAASGAALLAVVILAAVAGNYVFGGSSDRVYHGPITAPTLVPTNGSTLFALDQSHTTANFTIHEMLFGKPKTVVGKTQGVAGQILIDAHQPSRSKLSTIRVDMSTLATDDERRTHTLHSRILETYTAANQYATFVPTGYTGLPASMTISKPVTFRLHGNLTVHGVTLPETFTVTLTQINATQVTGTATTIVNYADFKLAIPNIPFVSDVGKSVVLTLDFAGTKAK